jgi:non-heme dioxygenase-like protein
MEHWAEECVLPLLAAPIHPTSEPYRDKRHHPSDKPKVGRGTTHLSHYVFWKRLSDVIHIASLLLSSLNKSFDMAPQANIPIIDISDAGGHEAHVARQLVDAAVEHGFIYIKNTGQYIGLSDVDGAFDLVTSLYRRYEYNGEADTNSPRSSSRQPLSRRRLPAPSRRTTEAGLACTLRLWIPRPKRYDDPYT